MMRPWKIWCLFGLCAGVVLAAMGWVSLSALRLEHLQVQAARQAEVEERARLALWRMDSALAAILIEESLRSPSAVPELTSTSSNVLLRFQLDSDGRLRWPLDTGSGSAKLAAMPDSKRQFLASLKSLLESPALQRNQADLAASVAVASSQPAGIGLNGELLVQQSAPPAGGTGSVNLVTSDTQFMAQNYDVRQSKQMQQARNSIEYANRANIFQQQGQQAVFANNSREVPTPSQVPAVGEAMGGMVRPVWVQDHLMLVRRVNRDGIAVVQGVWLNWTNVKASLLQSVKDLLPSATLQPLRDSREDRQARLLASLPVRLDPGRLPLESSAPWTPLRLTLLIAWACALVAALAVAALLQGTLALSERRAAFVSAVTHELRTPLTTFKMYSEMLAEDMVRDPAKRQQYLQTLSVEANRLSHLVENVLAYARLEKGSARSRVEKLTLRELLERVKPRLVQRISQAEMALVEDVEPSTAATVIHVDVSAVEQILFNLVDNACKYGTLDARENRIHLEALPDGKFAMLRVRDHGQGISAEGIKRLFQPFSKSAHEAAHTAPGVGLGLALCRRLSRSMGGDLRLSRTHDQGACFELLLPLQSNSL